MPEQKLTMEAYRETAGALPRPSKKQIAGFVEFVSSAHSWYKHLPLVPPGTPFHFFLNPHVACDMSMRPTGEIEYRKRRKQGFHYSEWPTSEYLTKCGYLDYRCLEGVGTVVKPLKRRPIARNILAQIRAATDLETRRAEMPPEILLAGTVSLTGIIHRCACMSNLWRWRSRQEHLEKSDWPSETGGRAMLARILDVAHRPDQDDSDGNEPASSQIDALIEPERQRLKRLMRDAVERVLELVYRPD